MSQPEKIDYSRLEVGYEFPPSRYHIDSSMAEKYIEAVEETSGIYRDSGLVPPTALAAYSLAALAGRMELLPGTIHVSQELNFSGAVRTGDTITCHAVVNRKHQRMNMCLLDINIDTFDQDSRLVMKGKTSFVIPTSD
jgi:acyl dehydratase